MEQLDLSQFDHAVKPFVVAIPPRRGAVPPTDRLQRELTGRVRQIRQCFENEDGTAFLVADLDGGQVIRGPVDNVDEIIPHQWFRFLGRWAEHEKWGWGFNFDSFIPDAPADADSVIAYLAQHCPGIGPARARKLVDAYGADVAQVLVDHPDRVFADGILPEDVAQASSAALRELCDPATRDAHLQLNSMFRGIGVPRTTIKTCLRKWGANAAAVVKRDAFLLLTDKSMKGIGFLRADRLFTQNGGNPNRLKRQGLAAWHAVSRKHAEGDTWIGFAKAVSAIREGIGGTSPRPTRALGLMYRARWLQLRQDDDGGIWVAERGPATNEAELAVRIRELRKHPACWPTGVIEGLSEHQQEELSKALAAGPIVNLTGAPGTGKTHSAAQLLRVLVRAVGRDNIAVAAPTGKAAVRISEKMSEAGLPLVASTIHRLLGVRQGGKDGGWSFSYNEHNPLPIKILVIDESSMLGVDLAASLFRALMPGTHVLLCGDIGQLPPVPHGAPLRDLITAGLPTARLTEIRRNSGAIVETCTAILYDRPIIAVTELSKLTDLDNLAILPAGNGAARQERLMTVLDWCQGQGFNLRDDVQVLSAKNDTRKALNKILQPRVNPDGEKGTRCFRVGDKVIQTKNGYLMSAMPKAPSNTREFVANGDLGTIERFVGKRMVVRLRSPDRVVWVPLGKAAGGPGSDDDAQDIPEVGSGDGDPGEASRAPQTGCSWDLAYCCTCHKFQGSEVPVCIVLLEGAQATSREWVYTAISRAKKRCVVIGNRADLTATCANSELPSRKTFLVDLLKEGS